MLCAFELPARPPDRLIRGGLGVQGSNAWSAPARLDAAGIAVVLTAIPANR